MNKEAVEIFKGFYDTLSIYLHKYAGRPAKDKSHVSTIQSAGEYYEEYQKFMKNHGENEFLSMASQLFLDVQTAVEAHNIEELKSLHLKAKKELQIQKDLLKYAEKFSAVFQLDVQQMKLQEEKIKSCQALVDTDLKINGRISEMTKEALELLHAEVVEGKVWEKKNWESPTQKDTPSVGEVGNGASDDITSFLKRQQEKIKELEENAKKKTLVVNAFAGPGAGKTTACMSAVVELKKMGYVVEYVPEYAKELVYDNPKLLDGSKENQLHILEEQLKRLNRFMGKVDMIVTDASLLLNPIYLAEKDPDYTKAIVELYGKYENFNFFVERGETFVQEGRMENQNESVEKDQQIKELLDKNSIFYGKFNHKTVDKLAEKIEITYKRINEGQKQQEAPYQALAYVKKAAKAEVIYGNSREELLSKLREANQSRTEEQKYHSCYIRKLDPKTNHYENGIRYEVESGKDITPIYLNLPKMERNTFMQTIEKLKENGAKYNGLKRAFYVTKGDNDLKLFAAYLPGEAIDKTETKPYVQNVSKSPHRGREKRIGDKPSVMEKLEANKGKIGALKRETTAPVRSLNL